MTLKIRKVILVLSILCLTGVLSVLYRPAMNLIDTLHTHSYSYAYFSWSNHNPVEAVSVAPATAVPILMYHGVRAKGELGTNITRDNFIEQMEMLKEQGYQTISVAEYDMFRQGKFTLPAKPIIITFDDGRKDSFYTVDEVLRKLNFKATMFVATVKPIENDPFFLSWSELMKLLATDRWEIEAHGRHSHDEVIIDENGNKGRYLTSRIYNASTGLESISDFKDRVNRDYTDGKNDLKEHLGVNPRYYAVPLNDYGNINMSNYDGALEYNKELTKKNFSLAFIESLDENNKALETFYNYQDSPPYEIKRLEVKNMSASELKFALDKYAPSEPTFAFPAAEIATESVSNHIQKLYGNYTLEPSGLMVGTTVSSTAARTLLGDRGWKNYSITAEITKGTSREASLLIYYQNEDNMIILDWDSNFVEVSERIDGVDNKIITYPLQNDLTDKVHVVLSVVNSSLSVSFNDLRLVSDYTVTLKRGAPGFGVWDPHGGGVVLNTVTIKGSN